MGSFKNIEIDEIDKQDNTSVATDSKSATDNSVMRSKQSEHNIISIPLDAITTDFKNTRRKVNQSDVDGLKQSIGQIGLISAITVVAMSNEQYQLVSGFNRVEALRQLGYLNVNAIVLSEPDEANLLEANIAENMVRKGLSLGEQSSAIKRLFTTLEGTEENKIDQISIRLNLSKKAVKDRLTLTALNEAGLEAFDEGKINLKSAIVLAGLTADEQDKFLSQLINRTLTHEGLLEEIGKTTIPLTLAKFYLTDCHQCPSNSQLQGSLFSDADNQGDAQCRNPSCFKSKSKAWLDNRVDQLTASYGTIIPVSQVDRSEINIISADSLGETQIQQCAVCTNNINLIQNKVGDTFGDVMQNLCNNKACHTECAARYQASHAPADAIETRDEELVDAHNAASPAIQANKNMAKNATVADKPVATATMSSAARTAARTAIAKVQLDNGIDNPQDIAMLSLLATLRLVGKATGSLKAMDKAKDMTAPALQAYINELLVEYLTKSQQELGDTDRPIGNVLIGLLQSKGELEQAAIKSWTPAHLKNATKAGIKAILIEAGFDHFFDKNHKKGAFNALMNDKLDAIHKAISSSNFDFSDFAPKAYMAYAQKVAKNIR